MPQPNSRFSREDRFHKAFLLLLVIAISAAFIAIIRDFLLIILLAAVFAGVSQPIYQALVDRFGGRPALASLVTILLLFILVVGPLATVATIVLNQAIQINESVGPAIAEMVKQPTDVNDYLQRLPFFDRLEPYRSEILTRIGELASVVGTSMVRWVTGTIGGTVIVLVQFIILLYTMFFLLKDGKRLLDGVLAYVPLPDRDKQQMVDRFVSVARATLKGTVLIGLIQGTLSGLAFWAAGVQGAVFWGTVMIVLSIVPGIGGALIWVPTVIVLVLGGAVLKAILLGLFCALVVGSIDNVLRPRLVGRDTRLHELLIFFSTIGGLLAFGPLGFIVGPIVAAMFVTVWELYGVAFRRELDESQG